ncbi:hypothetical protein BDZ45DRAFT_801137 [Acephala macrosclerotiorum]|nr:hypothetical protein BDZ45DRAFT_801137 [Acephala macrosclerotiorum]
MQGLERMATIPQSPLKTSTTLYVTIKETKTISCCIISVYLGSKMVHNLGNGQIHAGTTRISLEVFFDTPRHGTASQPPTSFPRKQQLHNLRQPSINIPSLAATNLAHAVSNKLTPLRQYHHLIQRFQDLAFTTILLPDRRIQPSIPQESFALQCIPYLINRRPPC